MPPVEDFVRSSLGFQCSMSNVLTDNFSCFWWS